MLLCSTTPSSKGTKGFHIAFQTSALQHIAFQTSALQHIAFQTSALQHIAFQTSALQHIAFQTSALQHIAFQTSALQHIAFQTSAQSFTPSFPLSCTIFSCLSLEPSRLDTHQDETICSVK
uniref:Uncharacterized protein n=1 Tax=Electrophorus electricus TaxID=8005 RepID=A0AAY5ELY6_ELEEL